MNDQIEKVEWFNFSTDRRWIKGLVETAIAERDSVFRRSIGGSRPNSIRSQVSYHGMQLGWRIRCTFKDGYVYIQAKEPVNKETTT